MQASAKFFPRAAPESMSFSASDNTGGGGGGGGRDVDKRSRPETKGEAVSVDGDKKRRVETELGEDGGNEVTRMEPVKYSDCTLSIGGRDSASATHTYHCHRAVLARGSVHLAAAFDSGETNVHLSDGLAVPMKPRTMGIFLRLLYDSELHDTLITSENVRGVCELAQYLDATNIVRRCELRLISMHAERRGPASVSVSAQSGHVAINVERPGYKFPVGAAVSARWKSTESIHSCFVIGHAEGLTYQLLYADGDMDMKVPEPSILGREFVAPHPLVLPKLISQVWRFYRAPFVPTLSFSLPLFP